MTPDAAPPGPDRAAVLDRGAGLAQRWGIRLIVLAAVLYVLGWAIGMTWVIWFPVLLAILLSTVLAPPVTWLRHHKVPDTLAAVLVMVVGIGLIALLFMFMVPQIIDEAPGIADSATGGLSTIQEWLTEGPLGLSEEQINGYLAAIADQIQSSADVISTGVFAGISSATNAVVNLAIILVLTFLFIKDGHRFLPWVDRVAGRRAGRHLTEVLGRVWRTIGGFIRTQAVVSLIDAVIIGVGLVVVGVPLAIPLALLTFFGGFIPIVGAIVAGALAVLVTVVTNGPGDALIVLLIILAVQQLEGNVLSPWLQGKIMNLHAAIVLLSVTAGSTLFGITGAFLAVPVVAAVAEVLRYLDDETTAVTAPGAEPGRAPDAGDVEARKRREEATVGVSDAAVGDDVADPAIPDTPARPDRDAPSGKPAARKPTDGA
ncbi:AI-2E family transporter [Nocardioides sp. CFH 31398]|uniref:AI-2E family transporter n=1 Tax=Nocardioides sp. CFH 31398 TaxID=2919579 RepID=UPI001F0506ED|nr:AI-2E family transporter [Nocardioides sp. CFH 31398]MCH1865654.1 AI-2E family transporter [Nocardioides sp. CFH 31398]